jgi:cytochrome c5
MKMKKIFSKKASLTISSVLIALWLPSVTYSQGFPEKGEFAAGAKSWADNCARCHNMRDPQDLRDDQWITTAFHMRLRAGLTGQQTRDILTFLQASNNRAKEVDVVQQQVDLVSTTNLSGEDVYNQTCIACHGANGKGMVPGAPDFTKSNGPLVQSDEVLLQHITEGFMSKGSPMAMPPKGGNSSLTESDIRAVLQHMKKTFSN